MNPASDHPKAILEQAERLKQAEKFSEAVTVLERLLSASPDHVEALEELADIELSLEHFGRALTAAERAISLDPKSYTGHYILGFLASQREDWGSANEHLRLSNRLHPNNPEILRCLGWALFNGHQEIEGIVTLERALNIDPTSIPTLCDLGVAYVELKNFPKARALFQRSLDIDPGCVRALECLEMMRRIEKHMAKK